MKTTLDLPEALVRQLERRAEESGQEISQAAEELILQALALMSAVKETSRRAAVKTHALSGLPYLECAHPASPAAEMTPERVADILLQQEVTWQHEAGR